MALKATAQRFGTTRRQRNQPRTFGQQAAYVLRTWGSGAHNTFCRVYAEQGGNLAAAYNAIAPYRFPHRSFGKAA